MQLDYSEIKDDPMILDYRGEHIEFKFDELGQSVYTTWNNKEYNLGSYNSMYKDDMKYIIDNYKDTITRFENYKFHGCRLSWFENGTSRDIKLTYRLRILKVFLVSDPIKVNTEQLIEESVKILNKII